MKTVFTSDLHFSHKRIVEFTNRSKETTQEMHDEWLIDLWNSQVDKADTIWHLGDFSFHHDIKKTEALIRRLNGSKFFIKGNHCSRNVMKVMNSANLVQWFGDYKEIKIGTESACLFHFPMAVWHKQQYGSFHLHGHSHGNYHVEQGKILDVGLDSAYNIYGKHKFFTEQDVVDYMDSRKMHVLDHHVERKGEM